MAEKKTGGTTKDPEVEQELKWFGVRTSSGNYSYRAADASKAEAMHNGVVPTDTIIEVVEQ